MRLHALRRRRVSRRTVFFFVHARGARVLTWTFKIARARDVYTHAGPTERARTRACRTVHDAPHFIRTYIHVRMCACNSSLLPQLDESPINIRDEYLFIHTRIRGWLLMDVADIVTAVVHAALTERCTSRCTPMDVNGSPGPVRARHCTRPAGTKRASGDYDSQFAVPIPVDRMCSYGARQI